MEDPTLKQMTVKELTDTIKAVHEAVDASDFGPVFQYGGTAEAPQKIVSPLGAQVFVSTLNQILAKSDVLRIIPNRSESMIET